MKGKIYLNIRGNFSINGYQVRLEINHSKKRSRIVIGNSFMDHWNESKQLPLPTHPQYQELFSKIVEIRSKINTLRFSDEKSIKDALNYLLDKTSVKENVVDFYQFVDGYVDKLHARDKIGTAKKIINYINQLKKYKPRLYFDEINKSFINGFKEYKLSDYILLKSGKKKYTSQITVHTYLRTFRTLYNKGVDKYDLPEINPFKNVFKDIVIVKNQKKIFI